MHRRPHTFEQVDDDETKLGETYKHIMGILVVYIYTLVGMVMAIGLIYFLLPSLMEDNDQALFLGSVFAGVCVIASAFVIFITTYVYNQNRIIITDRNVTQILQYGLFSRKISQLNIVNVEDVTSIQNGLLPTLLNYGTLKIETAGEQANFTFTYCPNSNYFAKLILDARERMLGQTDGDPSTNTQKRPRTNVAQKSDTQVQELGAEVVEKALKS